MCLGGCRNGTGNRLHTDSKLLEADDWKTQFVAGHGRTGRRVTLDAPPNVSCLLLPTTTAAPLCCVPTQTCVKTPRRLVSCRRKASPLTRGEMISRSVCVPDEIIPVGPAGSPVHAPSHPAADTGDTAVATRSPKRLKVTIEKARLSGSHTNHYARPTTGSPDDPIAFIVTVRLLEQRTGSEQGNRVGVRRQNRCGMPRRSGRRAELVERRDKKVTWRLTDMALLRI